MATSSYTRDPAPVRWGLRVVTVGYNDVDFALAPRPPFLTGTRAPHARATRPPRPPRREPASPYVHIYTKAHVHIDAAALIDHWCRVVSQRLTVQIIGT